MLQRIATKKAVQVHQQRRMQAKSELTSSSTKRRWPRKRHAQRKKPKLQPTEGSSTRPTASRGLSISTTALSPTSIYPEGKQSSGTTSWMIKITLSLNSLRARARSLHSSRWLAEKELTRDKLVQTAAVTTNHLENLPSLKNKLVVQAKVCLPCTNESHKTQNLKHDSSS